MGGLDCTALSQSLLFRSRLVQRAICRAGAWAGAITRTPAPLVALTLPLSPALPIAARTALRANAAILLEACGLTRRAIFRGLRRAAISLAAWTLPVSGEHGSDRQQPGGHDDCKRSVFHNFPVCLLFSSGQPAALSQE